MIGKFVFLFKSELVVYVNFLGKYIFYSIDVNFLCYLTFMRGIKFNIVVHQARMAIFYILNQVRFSHKVSSKRVYNWNHYSTVHVTSDLEIWYSRFWTFWFSVRFVRFYSSAKHLALNSFREELSDLIVFNGTLQYA